MNKQERPLLSQPTFAEICTIYQFGEQALWDIATKSGVPKSVIDVMCVGTIVDRPDTEKVLSAIAMLTGQNWTLDNTDIVVVGMEKQP